MKNFFVFKFSRKARFKLAITFTGLCLFQVVLGILISAWSLYICLSVAKHLYSEKAEITFVFTVTCIYGTHIIIQYLIGIKIGEKCFLRAHKRSTKRNLYCWIATSFNTIGNVLIVAMMSVKISKHIVRSIRHSMEKGMRYYLKDPIWKHTIDRWQFYLQCCGVNTYKDWYELSWLDKYHIDASNSVAQSYVLSKDHLHFPVVPWSCCDVTFPMQCFHDPLQQIQFAHLWTEQPDFLDKAIYNTGCLDILRRPIEFALIGYIFISVLLLLNQFAIIAVSRLLYTSCRNAVVLRDQHGDSPGWLFGRDCLRMKKGRTVSEVMLDLIETEDVLSTDGEESNSPRDEPRPKMNVLVTPRGSERNPISSDDEEALML